MKICAVAMALMCFVASMGFAQSTQKNRISQPFPVDSILGKWGKYSSETETTKRGKVTRTRILCNVCQEINFKADSTATIKLKGVSKSAADVILWKIEGRSLIVRNLTEGKIKTSFLSSGQYRINTRAGGTLGLYKDLVLTDSNGVHHVLTRSYD